ncbi:MAG TPA: nitroreductase family protein [Acidimicrobiales bacterium]|jgi:nitroreductase|nr:nitroreductase family protein [Acidimicrobiales bacterium]
MTTDPFVAPTLEEARERLRMPMVDAMQTQRAVRRLHTDPVDLELIYELLELSIKAPTSSNSQDWVYVVVTDRAQKERLGRVYVPIAKRVGAIVGERASEQDRRAMAPGLWQAEHFADIPLFVIPCYRSNLKHRSVGWPQLSVSSYYGSVYPAVQNLLLACRAVGLGASLQTLPIAFTPLAKQVLGLPRNLNPVCVIPIGWAKGKYGSTTRAAIEDVVHIDRYGNQPARADRG